MNPYERQMIPCPDCDAEGNVECWVWSKDEEGEIFKRPHKGVCSACQGTKEVLEPMEDWNERLIKELEKRDNIIASAEKAVGEKEKP